MVSLASAPLIVRVVHEATGREEQMATSILVGADGVHSQVAQAIGLASTPVIANLQARIPLPPDMPPDTARVWFCPRDTRFFYWLIPESAEQAVVGLATDSMAQARECLTRFLNSHGWRALAYQASPVASHRFHHRPWARIGNARVYLVGDAARQVKVTTIGGLVTGLWGAQAAAQAIIENREYGATLGQVQWELDLHYGLRAILDRFSARDYDELLRLLNEKILHLLRSCNRDQLAQMSWRLLLAQPRWIPFLGGILIRSLKRRPVACQPALDG